MALSEAGVENVEQRFFLIFWGGMSRSLYTIWAAGTANPFTVTMLPVVLLAQCGTRTAMVQLCPVINQSREGTARRSAQRRHRTQSQHTVPAHRHSTPPQHTATAYRHGTPPRHSAAKYTATHIARTCPLLKPKTVTAMDVVEVGSAGNPQVWVNTISFPEENIKYRP